MKYLIHSCKKRYWYVKNYLIPSMVKQGIREQNIHVYLDYNDDGCLQSCMKSFNGMPDDNTGTWHLQDDVIICSDFKERTLRLSSLYDGIICGYCYRFDDNRYKIGNVKAKEMWYSFPCIYIPNKVARDCANWFYNKVVNDGAYFLYVKSKKHDDTLFRIFVEDYYPNIHVTNLSPNLVDHIDYLIGGSIINNSRDVKETHAVYFEESELVKELEKEFNFEK